MRAANPPLRRKAFCYNTSMPASKQIRVLSVRLPQNELRRFKSLAVRRGVTLQKAVREALRAWEASNEPNLLLSLDELQGSLAGFDVVKAMLEDREHELAKDKARL